VRRPVQVLVPKTDEALIHILKFLKDNNITGGRVGNIGFDIRETDFTVASFVAGPTRLVPFTFAIIPATGAIPVYQTHVECNVVEVPGTDFQSWLLAQSKAQDVIDIIDRKLTAMPAVRPLPEGVGEKTIGQAINDAERRIEQSSPENQNISLLGTQVPGALATVAAPVASMMLLVYLLAHTHHLRRLSHDHAVAMSQVAWLPMSSGRSGWMDVLFTLVLVPAIVYIIMTARLWSFSTSRAWVMLLTGACTFVGAIMAVRTMHQLHHLRNTLEGHSS
jgi:hypothetical protein